MSEWLRSVTGIEAETAERLIATLAFVLSLVVMRWVLLAVLRRRGVAVAVRYRWRRATAYVVGTISLVTIGFIWLRGFGSVATFAGLFSAGLAIALRDVAANIAGWLFILWRRPFVLGDRIELSGLRGDVVDIGLFHHSVMEVGNWVQADDRTGRIIQVPNAKVFTEPVANYTKGWFEQIWDELAVVVTFESNWQEARRILETILNVTSQEPEQETVEPRATAYYLVLDAAVQPAVFTSVVDIGVQLTLRYLCKPRERRAAAQKIWQDVLHKFGERDDIDFAYPTQRFYNNAFEGKKALRPPAAG